MKELVVKVIENEPLVAGVYKMKFSLPEKTEGLACGRFINISTGDGGHLLRRPIAICEYTPDTVTICYQLKGEGTQLLSRVRPGDILSCVLPLGNGFAVEPETPTLLLSSDETSAGRAENENIKTIHKIIRTKNIFLLTFISPTVSSIPPVYLCTEDLYIPFPENYNSLFEVRTAVQIRRVLLTVFLLFESLYFNYLFF